MERTHAHTNSVNEAIKKGYFLIDSRMHSYTSHSHTHTHTHTHTLLYAREQQKHCKRVQFLTEIIGKRTQWNIKEQSKPFQKNTHSKNDCYATLSLAPSSIEFPAWQVFFNEFSETIEMGKKENEQHKSH